MTKINWQRINRRSTAEEYRYAELLIISISEVSLHGGSMDCPGGLIVTPNQFQLVFDLLRNTTGYAFFGVSDGPPNRDDCQKFLGLSTEPTFSTCSSSGSSGSACSSSFSSCSPCLSLDGDDDEDSQKKHDVDEKKVEEKYPEEKKLSVNETPTAEEIKDEQIKKDRKMKKLSEKQVIEENYKKELRKCC